MFRGMFVRPLERHAATPELRESGRAIVREFFANTRKRERWIAEHGECEREFSLLSLGPCTRPSQADLHAA